MRERSTLAGDVLLFPTWSWGRNRKERKKFSGRGSSNLKVLAESRDMERTIYAPLSALRNTTPLPRTGSVYRILLTLHNLLRATDRSYSSMSFSAAIMPI